MEMKIEDLISFDTIVLETEKTLSKVDQNGRIIVLRENKPAYIIVKCDENLPCFNHLKCVNDKKLTLHKAMEIILLSKEDKNMHASELSDEIFQRGLYIKKDSSKADYNQIRACANNYNQMFEILPGNIICLR